MISVNGMLSLTRLTVSPRDAIGRNGVSLCAASPVTTIFTRLGMIWTAHIASRPVSVHATSTDAANVATREKNSADATGPNFTCTSNTASKQDDTALHT